MLDGINRRSFLEMGMMAGAATVASRWMLAQAAPAADRMAQMRAAGATTPIKTTKLAGNLYLLQGAGGNMVLQTGADGNILIDSSFSTAVPKIREAIAAMSAARPYALINTHWHIDHTDGNAGMHEAGFTVVAHANTRKRLSEPHEMKALQMELPAAPAAALPTIAFADSLRLWNNGDTVDLVHFGPAHTDTDIYIHFQKADVLHLGDTWFNGIYPFIDESTGGSIGGMIRANEKALALAGGSTQIVPGHGPLGSKPELQKFHDMLAAIRDKVAAFKQAGASEQEATAKKPTAEFDAVWGKGFINGDAFTGIVYRTL